MQVITFDPRPFIKKGNIVTFKEKFYPRGTQEQGFRQIAITGIQKDKSGAMKLEGKFFDTPWFTNMDALVESLDLEFMQNVFTK